LIPAPFFLNFPVSFGRVLALLSRAFWRMNSSFKLGLHLVLVIGTCLFGALFYRSYVRFMDSGLQRAQADPVANLPNYDESRKASIGTVPNHMMAYGALFVVFAIGVGLVMGHAISHYVVEKTGKILFDHEGELAKTPEYELAEQEWANGNPLDAIQLMRNYLKEHPQEQHVALRIAEIYEKDLKNHLAAALEYEEVLKQKLQPEQWGWTAIHLCNLYSTKLNQPEKAHALLERIDAEYGNTAAAAKARKHLGLEEEIPAGDATPAPADPTPPKNRKKTGPASDEIAAEND
jgi:hypothetical protein